MKYLAWLLKAAIFFALFAFALNNQQDVTLPAWAATPVPGRACTSRRSGFRTSSRAKRCGKQWTRGRRSSRFSV